MTIQFANRATTLLTSSISDTDTLLAVSFGTGAKFPALSEEGQWFPVVVTDAGGGYEIMRATARAGDVLTVQRAQEGTIARAFTVCRMSLTRALGRVIGIAGAGAVRAHTGACFTLNKQVDEMIDAEQITTFEEVDAEFVK